jgi:hypothetical protein
MLSSRFNNSVRIFASPDGGESPPNSLLQRISQGIFKIASDRRDPFSQFLL